MFTNKCKKQVRPPFPYPPLPRQEVEVSPPTWKRVRVRDKARICSKLESLVLL